MEHAFYPDTSAIVKHYWEEEGSDFVDELYNLRAKNGGKFYTAVLVLPKFSPAAMRLSREGKLSKEEARSYINKFGEDGKDIYGYSPEEQG